MLLLYITSHGRRTGKGFCSVSSVFSLVASISDKAVMYRVNSSKLTEPSLSNQHVERGWDKRRWGDGGCGDGKMEEGVGWEDGGGRRGSGRREWDEKREEVMIVQGTSKPCREHSNLHPSPSGFCAPQHRWFQDGFS